jgi:hypothetical protein
LFAGIIGMMFAGAIAGAIAGSGALVAAGLYRFMRFRASR